jgi:hypothetical protein
VPGALATQQLHDQRTGQGGRAGRRGRAQAAGGSGAGAGAGAGTVRRSPSPPATRARAASLTGAPPLATM